MSELTLSPTEYRDTVNRIEDAAGLLGSIATTMFTESERQTLYVPSPEAMPRPSFAVLQATALELHPAAEYGHGLKLDSTTAHLLAGYPNMRVVFGVKTRDQRNIFLSGVVLPGDGPVLLGGLTADAMVESDVPTPPSTIRQLLLDELYTLQNSDRKTLLHQPKDAEDSGIDTTVPVNTAEIAHLSLVTSSSSPEGIHNDVHTLADDGTFAQKFSKAGSQSFIAGGKIRTVRNVVIPAQKALAIYVFPGHQPASEQVPTLGLTPTELAAGQILAATKSRGVQPNLEQNFTAVTKKLQPSSH